jgi:hypothetical protein
MILRGDAARDVCTLEGDVLFANIAAITFSSAARRALFSLPYASEAQLAENVLPSRTLFYYARRTGDNF